MNKNDLVGKRLRVFENETDHGPFNVSTVGGEFRAQVEAAVDTALHNVMDLVEGFWRAEAGPNHTAEFALSVCVKDTDRKLVERIDISPCLLDLPIGYWKWKDGEFR
jgi:hypothetical protein